MGVSCQSETENLSSSVYTVIAPAKLRPNIPFHISASAHNIPSPLEMKIGIEGPADSGTYNSIGRQITLNSGETQIINFEIGEWSSGNYSLIVTGEGGMKFRNQTVLTYESKSYSVFIQTDKAIYKPGQLVQFRVLVVNPHLLPTVTGAINVFITDASGNRIKQWDRLFTSKGVLSAELLLSDQPVLGNWIINVDILGQVFKKLFTVAEYVLPTFEVSIDLPPFATFKKSDIVATVNARYTYGKPVKGHCKLIVKPSLRYGYLSNENKPAVTETKIDGSVDIPLNLVSELNLKDDEKLTLEIDVIAEVEEELTTRRYNATSSIRIYEREIKVELIKQSESFKAGLKYSAQLKVAYQDDTPVIVTNGDQVILNYGYGFDPNVWETKRISVPSNGLVDFEFFPPSNTNDSFLSMAAEFRGEQYFLGNVEAALSPSNNFIQVYLRTKEPMVDKQIELEINATEKLTHIVYEVLGRGDIVQAGTVKIPNVTTYTFPLSVNYRMAPKARVVVYYVREENNEIVADAVNFDVAGVFRTPVSIDTSVKETKPGGLVNVTVDTKPNALVGLLGVDQSVLLLKSGNDITRDEVITELETYDGGKKRRWYNPFYRKKRSSLWAGSSTTYEVFDDSGVVVLTNGLIYRQIQIVMYRSHHPLSDDLGSMDEVVHDAVGSIMYKNGKGSMPRVRKHFPETWLWTLNSAGNNGKMSIASKVPDTITSWVISAFAMDTVTGLGIATENAKVTVFRQFFIKLNLPYSVIRGESMYVEAIIFNYNKKPVKAEVTLDNSRGEFEFAATGNEVEPQAKHSKTKTIKVPAEDGASAMFLITPKKLGYIELKVTAIAPNAGDTVVRKLLVKAEGAPQYYNQAVLVDLRNPSSKQIRRSITVPIPEDAVEGSQSVMISAIGDLLGPTVNNLHQLLRMPYGCGEQNMLNFVPNIAITEYLKRANRLTPEIKKKALNFMESGYQRELTYKRSDGSFSAFGSSDKNGSTWLTAFVVRSFHQAKGFIDIDDNVMAEALQYLSKRQKPDGSFEEIGEVHHKAMQGGSGSGSALTGYVLLAFLENHVAKNYTDVINLALDYVVKEANKTTDPYVLSVISYALHLADRPDKEYILQKLFGLATRGVDTMHWSRTNSEERLFQSLSQDVEMTAYVLLTYVLRADTTTSLPILRWMISQQNENGGYSSTQDTIVGIQALAGVASYLVSPTISIVVTFSHNDGERNFLNITSENAMVLQKIMLPSTTRTVDLEAVGFGVGIIQVSWSYNLKSTEKVPGFSLKPILSKRTTDDYMELDICTSYNENGASNMAVMEVSLPSGYQADEESFPSIQKHDVIKRVESQDGSTNVVIYFDRIGVEELCISVPAHRSHKVANQKPVPVRVYDYYNLAKSARMFYEPREVTVCKMCEGEDCSDVCNSVTDGKGAGNAVSAKLLVLAFSIVLALSSSFIM